MTLDHYEMDPRAFREAGPSFSPDSPESNLIPWSRLVYQSYRTDNWDIYFSDDTGYFETRLTTFGGDDIHPRLNRGCTKVVYASRQNGDYEIFVMINDGTNKTQLTSNNTDDVFPYWSPDGTKIVFQAYRDGQPEIYVMNADGTNQTRLTHSSDYDGMPAWSPDGTLIAFSSRRTGVYRIYTMNTGGSSEAQRSNQSYSVKHIGGMQTALLGLGELLVAILFSHLFLKESLTFIQWIGMAGWVSAYYSFGSRNQSLIRSTRMDY